MKSAVLFSATTMKSEAQNNQAKNNILSSLKKILNVFKGKIWRCLPGYMYVLLLIVICTKGGNCMMLCFRLINGCDKY